MSDPAFVLQYQDFSVVMKRKNINIPTLSMDKDTGALTLYAPHDMSDQAIQDFIQIRTPWITQNLQEIQDVDTPLDTDYNYVAGEEHYLAGDLYTLKYTPSTTEKPRVVKECANYLHLYAHPNASTLDRKSLMSDFYFESMRRQLHVLLDKWEPILDIKVSSISIRPMKTRWGSMTAPKNTMRLNIGLAQCPPHLLEYMLVYLMLRTIERDKKRFKEQLATFFPEWASYKEQLGKDFIFVLG